MVRFLIRCLPSLMLTLAYTPNFRPFLRSQDMTGIWRLTHESSLVPNTGSDDRSLEEEILLRLNEDGSFDRYETSSDGEGQELHETLGRGGSWEFRDDTLFLAPERPTDADPSKVHDTLLAGKLHISVSDRLVSEQNIEQDVDSSRADVDGSDIGVDVHLSISEGKVSIGKFMYPRKHKAFFDDPMLFRESSIGKFTAAQVLGNLNARLKSDSTKEAKPEAKFHKKDFHGRRFYLTATPHPVHEGYAKQDKRFDESKVLHDVRVFPIAFHANNTFSAEGTEKILRGRYGLTGQERDRLWFQVSLFGAGRSAPGSVYSEGRLLSHDDRRGYLGRIQEVDQEGTKRMFIEGEFYYGTDLKRAIKPNSMGVFAMQEIITGVDTTSSEAQEKEDMEWRQQDFGDENAFQ
eukprot:scaffold154_cov129-Cylindrotheca_fusiformis.AAC.30